MRSLKKKIICVFVVMLTFVLLLSLSGCGQFSGVSAQSGESSVNKIGIALPTKSFERWIRDGEYLRANFEEAGYTVDLKYSYNDISRQNNDIKNMISDEVDLLLVAAIDGEALSDTLSAAKDAGIPVIAYDRLILGTDAVSYYVSFDNYTVGKLQGEYVIDALDLENSEGPFNIEFVAGDLADNNALYFFNGAYDTIKKYIESGKLQIPSGKNTFKQTATAQWDTDTAMANMQNTFASYYSDGKQLDAAICSNDSTALGVTQAVELYYNGVNNPIITGQDGDVANLKNIVDNKQSMTVYKNVNDEASVAFELSKAILSGQTPAEDFIDTLSVKTDYDTESYDNGVKIVPSYLLDPYVITKDNLQILADTGLYKWDNAKKYLESTTSG